MAITPARILISLIKISYSEVSKLPTVQSEPVRFLVVMIKGMTVESAGEDCYYCSGIIGLWQLL